MSQLQQYYGVSADGLWGANSTKAAGGLTADEAWRKMRGLQQQVGMNRTANGRQDTIKRLLDGGQISEAQAESLLGTFGLLN